MAKETESKLNICILLFYSIRELEGSNNQYVNYVLKFYRSRLHVLLIQLYESLLKVHYQFSEDV